MTRQQAHIFTPIMTQQQGKIQSLHQAEARDHTITLVLMTHYLMLKETFIVTITATLLIQHIIIFS